VCPSVGCVLVWPRILHFLLSSVYRYHHNVQYCMNLKSVTENFVLQKMFQLQKEDASCPVCMSCDFQ